MENHKLVLPEHLNHYGCLFGGDLLKWVDEYAYIAAAMEYPGSHFVTVGMDDVEFKKSVKKGTILKFVVDKIKEGNTSIQFLVTVSKLGESADAEVIFSTNVTFVRIDEDGCRRPLRDV